MAYAGRVRPKGSCRVAFDVGAAPFIVAGTNNGYFTEPLVDVAPGVVQMDLNRTAVGLPAPANGLAPQDTIIVTPEGVAATIAVVERVSATRIVVRLFTELGVAADIPYAIQVYGVFQG